MSLARFCASEHANIEAPKSYTALYFAHAVSLYFLFTILTCAHRMRVHFCPQHWLLCHLGLY